MTLDCGRSPPSFSRRPRSARRWGWRCDGRLRLSRRDAPDPGLVVDQTMTGCTNNYLLLAVPLFIFVAT